MRRPFDQYETPRWAIDSLLDHFPEISGHLLFDPCAGRGLMAQKLVERGRFQKKVLNDMDPAFLVKTHLDASQGDSWQKEPNGFLPEEIDWIITNPPYACAGEIVRQSLCHAQKGVAMLLRCTFLEPCQATSRFPQNDRSWLTLFPPTAILSLPRISFTDNGGTDSAPAWWFLWSDQIRPQIQVVERQKNQRNLKTFVVSNSERKEKEHDIC